MDDWSGRDQVGTVTHNLNRRGQGTEIESVLKGSDWEWWRRNRDVGWVVAWVFNLQIELFKHYSWCDKTRCSSHCNCVFLELSEWICKRIQTSFVKELKRPRCSIKWSYNGITSSWLCHSISVDDLTVVWVYSEGRELVICGVCDRELLIG